MYFSSPKSLIYILISWQIFCNLQILPFQYLPAPDQFTKLSQFKEEYEDLAEPEKFVLSLSDIKR